MSSYTNPTYQNPGKQSLQTLLDALKLDISKNINCVKVGTVVSFNAMLQEVTVQIAFQQVTSTAPDGTQTLAQYPLLLNVPVYFPSGGGFTLTFPVAAGDECILLFNDRQIDNWLATGAGKPPNIARAHDLSDGIALVGLRNNTRALGGVSTGTAQLRSDNGETYVEVAGGGIVNVVAPTKVKFTTPIFEITGILDVQNLGSSSTPCTVNGDITTNGDVIASSVSLVNHVHSDVQSGSSDTGPPV